MISKENLEKVIVDFVNTSVQYESKDLGDLCAIEDFCEVVNKLYYQPINGVMTDYIEPYIGISGVDLDFSLPFKVNGIVYQLNGTFRYGHMRLCNYGKD